MILDGIDTLPQPAQDAIDSLGGLRAAFILGTLGILVLGGLEVADE